MAFYGYYNCHADDFYSIPYPSSEYNMVPTSLQASFSPSSWYEFNEPMVREHNYFITPSVSNYMVNTEPELVQYSHVENHYSDHEFDGWNVNPSEINYSVFHLTEPKLLQYDPSLSSETKSTISYSISTQEFNEPEFKEYSPDPYRGGYDPITTYGRPLPPSDEICYPRSDVVPLDGFDYGSIASPYGKDDQDNLISTKLPITIEEIDEETDLETDVLENGGEVTGTGVQGETGEPQPTPSDDSHHKHDDDGFENGRNGDYDDKIGLQTSYGSGLEAMDLCESIFGYWPCLDKIQRQQRDNFREICDQESRRDPWKIAADYLFGSPGMYNYEHYHQIQYESYENNLWLPEV